MENALQIPALKILQLRGVFLQALEEQVTSAEEGSARSVLMESCVVSFNEENIVSFRTLISRDIVERSVILSGN